MKVSCPNCQSPLRVAPPLDGKIGLECTNCDYQWPREEEE